MAFPRRARVLAALLALGVVAGLRLPTADAVVGGSAVPQGAYPFNVALLQDGGQICGGSVIGSQWVLTAAHCVPDGFQPGYSVAIGNVDYTKGRVVAVNGIVVHPQYDATGASENDVALLHLAAPSNVTPIALVARGDERYEADGVTVTVAGWGSTTPLVGAVPPLGTSMRQANLRVVADASCSSIGDPASQLCAAALLKDSCQGDSGGPLFATGPDSRPILVGTVSYGTGCAIPGFDGVYGEVNSPSIRNFINSYLPGL